jgi:hypothetical protein
MILTYVHLLSTYIKYATQTSVCLIPVHSLEKIFYKTFISHYLPLGNCLFSPYSLSSFERKGADLICPYYLACKT